MKPFKQKSLLIISQVYIPDPAAVGQYLSDVAVEMVNRGWRVVVFTADRGYDNPLIRYAGREKIDGVNVRRFPFSSLGKNSLALRLAAAALFMLQSLIYGVLTPGLTSILVSTSPPMCSLCALAVAFFRRVPVNYWVMDLNPDQAIELGYISHNNISAKVFNLLNRLILKKADHVIALDQYMADRLNRKLEVNFKISVIPPWPLFEYSEAISHQDNPFRLKHGLCGKFVFMYSGNHTFTNPITTILKAALVMQNFRDILFIFIGGGLGKSEVDDTIRDLNPENIISLPYQPLEETINSLAAADVHIVSIGEKFSGIVHPSKIYGAMAAARPVLFLGPVQSHIGQIVCDNKIGWQTDHENVNKAVDTLNLIIATPEKELKEMGNRARQLTLKKFNRNVLLNEFCAIIDR